MSCALCDQPSHGYHWHGEAVCHSCYCMLLGAVEAPTDHLEDANRYIAPPLPKDRKKVASDGLSTDYYRLPDHATELRHVISHKGMSFARGNLFKACYRLGEKEGVDILYDLNKMKFFIEDLIEMHKRGEPV